MNEFPDSPPERTIHERFGAALLEAALASRGVIHRDYRVHIKEEIVRVYMPRRSDNDPAPPPKPHSDPAQNLITAVTEHAGMYAVDEQIGGYDIFIPLVFEPHPNPAALPGLLGRISCAPCCYTLHCVPPGERDIHDALRYSFNLSEDKYKNGIAPSGKGKKRKSKSDAHFFPKHWIVGAELSNDILTGFGFSPDREKFPGIYNNAPGFGLQFITISQIPVTRETLVFRLLGTGAILEAALAEQAELPEDAIERVATTTALREVTTGAIPIEEAKRSPVLRACSKVYRQWAERMGA